MEPSRGKTLCVPFDSQEHSAACVANPEHFRQHLTEVCGQHPALFHASISEGFVLHDKSWSIKQQLMLRRIALKATAGVFLVRPSCLMPSMVGRTEDVAKALSLRHWGVPFDAVVSVFGRDAMDWYRAEMAVGRPAIVGSTVKQPEKLPAHVLADETHTWALGHAVSVATTVGGGCILGATVTDAASADALEDAYGACAQEARELSPTSSPKTVCTDGWEGTQSAWRRLVPTGCIRRCFLHAVLKIAERCGRDRATRTLVLDRVWEIENSCTRAQCSQRLRRLREWATAGLPEGALRQMVLTRCGTGPQFARAAPTRLVAPRSTTSMASSITPTGSTTCSSPPPWEVENYEPRNPIESDLFRVEWAFLPLLDRHHGAFPKLLERRLADDPAFFCEVIRIVFRSKKEEPPVEEATEQQQNIATNAYRLLSKWRTPPGSQTDGTYNGDALMAWLEAVKAACAESGHLKVALSMVGHVLIHTSPDPDGLWVHHAAATALNAKDAGNMRDGYRTALSNARGVHRVDPEGRAERELAAKYRDQAEKLESQDYRRLANALRELAVSYERDAERLASRDLFDN